jgi:hypothetical protein
MENKKSVFVTLNEINVNEHTEKKPAGNNKELTYLSWPWSWAEVKKRYPDASYTIYKDENNKPYIEDPDFGLMCMTTVTINGMTHEMWLPVMDGSNKAMRRQPYSYKSKNYRTGQWEDKWVQAATMFDINKTIMRCLVKNLAMFGLGLYIYAGEDLPETEADGEQAQAAPAKKVTKKAAAAELKSVPTQPDVATLLLQAEQVAKQKQAQPSYSGQAAPSAQQAAQKPAQPAVPQMNLSLEDAKAKMQEATTKEALVAIFNGNSHLHSNPEFMNALTQRKNQILNNNGTTAA